MKNAVKKAGPFSRPLTTLAALASATRDIRLATGVLIAPLRPPLLLAKTVATLDVLSQGRVDLGVGVGWQREELEAGGVPFEERWRRLDDTLRQLGDERAADFAQTRLTARETLQAQARDLAGRETLLHDQRAALTAITATRERPA